MNWILLTSFGASCLLLMLSPLRQRSGVLQFPLLAGDGVMGFLFLQALGLVRNDSLVPPAGLPKALIMCVLCNLAIFLAWQRPAPSTWRKRPEWDYPPTRLYWVGVLFLSIGAVGQMLLITLGGGFIQSLSVSNEITQWRGLPVVYLNIALFSHTGVVITCLAALRMQRSFLRLVPALPFLLLELVMIGFGARRTPLVTFGLSLFCLFYFSRRILPSKALLISFGLVAAAAMFVFPLIRSYVRIGADRSRMEQINFSNASSKIVEGDTKEFWSAVYLIQITDSENLFMLGGGFYNDFIRYFVPRSLVGDDGKASLFLDMPDPNQGASNTYGWEKPSSYVPTGPASAFIQFSYAGALLYWLLTRGMKYLWVRGSQAGDVRAQCLYILMLTPAMAAVVNDFSGALYVSLPQSFLAPLIALMVVRVRRRPSPSASAFRIPALRTPFDAPVS